MAAPAFAPTAEDEAMLLAFAAPSGIAVLGPPGMLPTQLEPHAERAA